MIRKFEVSDLESCARILMSVYNNEMWQCFWSFEKAKEYLKDIVDYRNFIGFTLLVEKDVKGAILCREKTWWNNNEIFVEEQRLVEGKTWSMALESLVEYISARYDIA